MPVVYEGKVYVAVGGDPEHGEGPGRLWCIDPARKFDGSDVSMTVVLDAKGQPAPRRRLGREKLLGGELIGPNPNTAAIWEYAQFDLNGNREIEFEERMHRSCGHVAIKDNLLYIADLSGLLHCVNATTGRPLWTYDLLAATWASGPLIVDGKVYVADEDGDIAVFKHGPRCEPLAHNNVGQTVYTSPVVANNVLYIASKTHLVAIENSARPD